MRAARLCRCAGRALAQQATKSDVAEVNSRAKASALGELRAGIGNDVSSFASSAGAATQKVFRGAATGTAYAPTSPLLRSVLDKAPTEESRHATVVSKPLETVVTPTAPVQRALSLAELKELPAAELQRMLAARGVGRSSATEKEDLAAWVHQHQDLPVVRPAAASGAAAPGPVAAKSLSELERCSVAELRDMLARRGVDEGSAREKGELAKWVWQHQDLPIIYSPEEGRRRQRWRRGFGGEGEPYDSQRKDQEPEREKLEAAEETKLLEGEDTKLLEGSTKEEGESRRQWPWAVGGLLVLLASVIGFLAVNDARQTAHDVSAAAPKEQNAQTPR
eukprot:TRINITY_DN2833_c0_g1_i1.p1 TRINITY_DN2833_c0_g1~~TRINITY_DN2833_c0_g1_i1.p1  ORF type:complete len:335 (+),score=75.87 TRINITY_DN2833_c0_g1_i1:28-1032(+)